MDTTLLISTQKFDTLSIEEQEKHLSKISNENLNFEKILDLSRYSTEHALFCDCHDKIKEKIISNLDFKNFMTNSIKVMIERYFQLKLNKKYFYEKVIENLDYRKHGDYYKPIIQEFLKEIKDDLQLIYLKEQNEKYENILIKYNSLNEKINSILDNQQQLQKRRIL